MYCTYQYVPGTRVGTSTYKKSQPQEDVRMYVQQHAHTSIPVLPLPAALVRVHRRCVEQQLHQVPGTNTPSGYINIYCCIYIYWYRLVRSIAGRVDNIRPSLRLIGLLYSSYYYYCCRSLSPFTWYIHHAHVLITVSNSVSQFCDHMQSLFFSFRQERAESAGTQTGLVTWYLLLRRRVK